MKTITRTLAFVLVIALAFSLTTAFAASYDDYTDAADAASSDYAEAIDFCVALGVINGMSETQLGLDGNLTRAQASKIVAYCVLGEKAAEALAASDTKFTDTVGHWAQKYIAYCASENIINGMNDTTFAPEGTLTGYQFAKMLLSALGYGIESRLIDGTTYEVNNYTGEYWATKVSADGNKLGLFEKLDDVDLNGEISRAEAMQMAFNAYGMSFNGPNNKDVNDGYVSDFSDGFFYTLKDYHKTSQDVTDWLGRPAHYWANKSGKAVTDTYKDEPVLTFVYSEYNQDPKVDEYEPTPDGVLAFLADQKDMKTYMKSDYSPKGDYKYYGKGDDASILYTATQRQFFPHGYATAGWDIEVFVTEEADGVEYVSAFVVPYLLMQVTSVDENAKAKEAEDWTVKAEIEAWNFGATDTMGEADTDNTTATKFYDYSDIRGIVYDKDDASVKPVYVAENIGDFEKDQYVIVTPAGLTSDNYMTLEIAAAESVEGTLTAMNSDKGYIKVDGTQYKITWDMQQALDQGKVKVDDQAIFYLNNGYVIGFSDVQSEKADNFVYIKDVEYKCDPSNFSNSVYIKLDVVFTNGDSKIIEIPVTKKDGEYSYKFDGNKYTLAETTSATRLADADYDLVIDKGWVGYITNDDGTYKLYEPNADEGQYVYSKVEFTDGSAVVKVDGSNAKANATSSTAASFIDKDNNVTTIKGFKNFAEKNNQEGDRSVLVIYTMDGSKATDIANIYAINADIKQETDYVYCVGDIEETADGKSYGFFESGAYVEYVMDTDSTVTPVDGQIYTLTIDNDKFDAKAPTDTVVFEGMVKSVTDGYINVIPSVGVSDKVAAFKNGDATLYYVTSDSNVYDITAGDNTIKDGTFAAKQVVTFVAETNDNGEFEIIDAFIVDGNYAQYWD